MSGVATVRAHSAPPVVQTVMSISILPSRVRAWLRSLLNRWTHLDALDRRLDDIDRRQGATGLRMDDLERHFEDWHRQLADLASAVMQRATRDELKADADRLHERIGVLMADLPVAGGEAAGPPGTAAAALAHAFYPALERQFRGTPTQIRERLTVYRPRLADLPGRRIADLGCGRGEWLTLLGEWGFEALGVDANPLNVDLLRRAGLEVACADACTWLRAQPSGSLAAVTAIHVVEHLPFDVLLDLLDQARRVLMPGGLLLLETPDPAHPYVATQGFWLDPTHRHPLPAPLLEFAVSWSGFRCDPVLRLNPDEEDPAQTRDYAVLARRPLQEAS